MRQRPFFVLFFLELYILVTAAAAAAAADISYIQRTEQFLVKNLLNGINAVNKN